MRMWHPVSGHFLDPTIPDVGFFPQELSQEELNKFKIYPKADVILGKVIRHKRVEILPEFLPDFEIRLTTIMNNSWRDDLAPGQSFVYESIQMLEAPADSPGQEWHLDSWAIGYVMIISLTGTMLLYSVFKCFSLGGRSTEFANTPYVDVTDLSALYPLEWGKTFEPIDRDTQPPRKGNSWLLYLPGTRSCSAASRASVQFGNM
jgi:hypothetical protein